MKESKPRAYGVRSRMTGRACRCTCSSSDSIWSSSSPRAKYSVVRSGTPSMVTTSLSTVKDACGRCSGRVLYPMRRFTARIRAKSAHSYTRRRMKPGMNDRTVRTSTRR